jgi:hypothetical protein
VHPPGMSDMVMMHQNTAAIGEADPTGVRWCLGKGGWHGGRRWLRPSSYAQGGGEAQLEPLVRE